MQHIVIKWGTVLSSKEFHNSISKFLFEKEYKPVQNGVFILIVKESILLRYRVP
jgi:hypothetical protein